MFAPLQHHTHVSLRGSRVVRRRDFLKASAACGLAAGVLNWTDVLAARADELRDRGMACILLWMSGGPSQFETFSPKPGHANGGETKAIDTSVAGIQIAENLPHMAKVANELAIIRSMTSKEGNHQRATYLLHHGYLPMASVNIRRSAPTSPIRSVAPPASSPASSRSAADSPTLAAAGCSASTTIP